MTRRRQVDGEVRLEDEEPGRDKAKERPPEISVMASGNLGLITFPREPGRVTREWIDQHHPRLIPALRDHPGIGFLLVRSEDGAVVIGKEGTRDIAHDNVEGSDPLAPFGPNAAAHVRRTDGFAHCPDIVVNSTYWPETDEVAAFEELVGSHGGMGGEQAYPFVLAPSEWQLPAEAVVGAENMHRWMRRWLADLGHAGFKEDSTRARMLDTEGEAVR